MPRYTAESKDRVRDAVDMVDLVGSRTELRRAGADSYSGLCPFHDERTPSFSVKPSDKVYYCFGCQAKGDAFTFVQEMEGVDFPGALELLADRYSVTLELEEEDPGAAERRRRRERLLELLERTCAYYERYLWEAKEAGGAREYLLGRGLDQAMLREFRVGYAPSAWDRVLLASRRGGFSEAELIAVGLAQRSRDQPGRIYDRFRARITFPLCDKRGHVLGFGARAMRDGDQAKYLNTADGEIYHKGQHLFGAHLARGLAAKAGSIVLCEGYTDVIATHQAGVRNCVGLMGTALTEQQVDELAWLAPAVVLALDADGPGQEAMLKAAARVASRRRVELRVVPLPAGSDPADVLARDGAAALAGVIEQAVAFVRFRVQRILAAGEVGSPEGRDRILVELRPVFAQVGPGAMREELEREVVARLKVSEKAVERLLAADGATAASAAVGSRGGAATLPALDGTERTERGFLELCIALPRRGEALLRELDLSSAFSSPVARAAAEHLRSHIDAPAAGVEDPALATLLAELSVRASALDAVPAQLEVERRQLELARIERAIDAARAGGGRGMVKLGREREAIRGELQDWIMRALEETAAAPG
ncbi:MAG: DNA primase [Solirubrobacteraceae bacterium]|jgi:DNA primase